MDEALIHLGRPEGLHFELAWTGPATGSAEDSTQGRLVAHLEDVLVWGEMAGDQIVGLEWTWIDLLEHPAATWPRIAWEQADPLGFGLRADRLRVFAEQHREEVELSEANEWALWQYEEAHNLAAALQGAWPRPLWVQREGLSMAVVGGATETRLPFTDVLDVLEELGEAIAARIHGLEDGRSKAALRAWTQRAISDPNTCT